VAALQRSFLRGTDTVAKLSLQTRRLSYDHEDGVAVKRDHDDAIDAKFNFARC
jgi:hypothetical protein